MPRPPSATVSDLLALLRGEPAPAAWLVQQLGVTRPVLSRLVAEAGGQVLRIDIRQGEQVEFTNCILGKGRYYTRIFWE